MFHRRGNGADRRILFRKRNCRCAECRRKVVGRNGRDAGLPIERVDAVVRLRVRLRGSIALSLHRHHMHNDRAMKILRPAQRRFECLFIVAVHRPDIVKPEIVKYTGRQKARFDALLEPVQLFIGVRVLFHHTAVRPLEAEISGARACAAEQSRHAADIFVDGHAVVVENDHGSLAACTEIAQSLKAQAAGHRAVANDGDNVVISVHERSGSCHPRGQRHGIGGVSGKKRIGVALARLGKAGNTVELAQRIKGISPTGQNLVDIGLMPDIEQDAVLHRVIDAVQRHRQLHTAEIRCKMPTGVRHVFHKKLADVPA